MKNIFKLFSLLMILLVTMVACEEEAEWYSDSTGNEAVYAQFGDTSWDLAIFTDAAGVPVTAEAFPIFVKLIGPAQKSDVTVGFKVTESTGASGEWSISSMSITIAAGTLSGSTMVNINKDATVVDSTYVIKLALDEATTTVPIYGNIAATATINVSKGLSCAYAQAEVVGSYNAVSADWAVDGEVTITADPDDVNVIYVAGLETIDGLTEDLGPLKMVIGSEKTTNRFEVTAVKTVLASLVTWGPPYHNIAYEGSGLLNTCESSYEMLYTITVDEGGFGDYPFTLTKN